MNVVRMGLVLVSAAGLLANLPAAAQGSVNLARGSEAALVSTADGSPVEGATAYLLRGLDWLAADLRTSGLEPGGTYTVWWVLFNNPGGCSPLPNEDPGVPVCNEDDVLDANGNLAPNPTARVSLLWGGGSLADADGRAVFGVVLRAGQPPGEVLLGSGLERQNGLRAEVHLVLRGHGPADAPRLAAQLTSFEMDCEVCSNDQAAIFPPER